MILQQLINNIRTYFPISNDVQQVLYDCFEKLVLAKNEFLVTERKVCRYLYFLEQGALRGYHLLDGKEITQWFAFENDFATSFQSFVTEGPSAENIQLLEGCVLWSISKEKLTQLFNQYPEIERLVRIAYEKYYIRLEERFVNRQFKTASELYEDLLQRTPHILERVPLGMVASYLGISQETLSRIRSRL